MTNMINKKRVLVSCSIIMLLVLSIISAAFLANHLIETSVFYKDQSSIDSSVNNNYYDIILKDEPLPTRNETHTLIKVEPTNSTVEPNSNFSIGIYCEPAQPIKSYELSITYNASLIQANKVTKGNIFNGYQTLFQNGIINNSNGEITQIYELIIGTGNISEPGYLIFINFTTEEIEESSPIDLVNVGATNESSYVPLEVINGSVLVKSTENKPIILSEETPQNNSHNISITLDSVSINITDPEQQPINWTIHGNYIQNNSQNQDNNGIKTANLITPLPFNTTIYWHVNTTDSEIWTNNSFKFTVRDKFLPIKPANFTATTVDRSGINLNWTKETMTDFTIIEYNSSANWPRGKGKEIYNDTESSFNHTELSPGTTYYYRAWSYNTTDQSFSETSTLAFNTTFANQAPLLNNEYPIHNSIKNDVFISEVNVSLFDTENDIMNWTINTSRGETNNGTSLNGVISCTLTAPLNYNETIQWQVNVTDGYNWTNATYTFTIRDKYNPEPPSNFSAITLHKSQINLTWTKDDMTDYTFICYKIGTSPPGNRTDGTILYNGTKTSTIATSLNQETTYTFAAWSFNSTDISWSSIFSSTTNTTTPNNPLEFGLETPENNSMNQPLSITWSIPIYDPDKDLFNWTIECTNGQTTSSVNDNNGLKTLQLINLSYNTTYTIWVNTTDGFNNTNHWFTFTTQTNQTPQSQPTPPPTFSATTISTTSIQLNWNKTSNSDYTLIEYNTQQSWTQGQGTLLYNNTQNQTTHTNLNAHTTYYYQAWSYNTTWNTYSITYAATSATTFNTPPTHGTPSPANQSTNQPLNLTWTIQITDQDGDLFNWTIECTNGQTTSSVNDNNGLKTLQLINLSYNTTYTIWVNTTDGFNNTNHWFTFTTQTNQTPQSQPTPPPTFSATTISTTSIQLNWNKTSNSDYTLIEYNTQQSWTQGQGTLLYNNTQNQTTHTNLNAHTTYYYQAWSYNTTWNTYSITYAATSATTFNTPPTHGTPSPANQSTNQPLNLTWTIQITDQDGDLFNWTIECTNGQTTSSVDDNNGLKTLFLTNLQLNTTYTLWVNSSDSYSTTSSWYTFTTQTTQTPPPQDEFTVQATADKTIATTHEPITFTASSKNGISPYQWQWDFGDGSSSTEKNPTHTYTTNASFTAVLTCTDNADNTASDSVTIQIVNPLTLNTNGPYNGIVNESIAFNAFVEGGTPPYTITWDFGDGNSSSNLSTSHIYHNPGIYNISVLVTDSNGFVATHNTTATLTSDHLIINANGPYEGIKGEHVQFYGSATNGVEPYSWLWDFGDSYSSTKQSPQHMYQHEGTYTVTLTVTDNQSVSSTTTTYAVITKPPDLNIQINGPLSEVVNVPVIFSATILNGKEPYTFHWDFGDGETSTNGTVSHIYIYPGVYNIQVQITDADDRQGIANTTIEIKQNIPPSKPTVSGEFKGESGRRYTYKLNTNDPDGDDVFYFIDWGDGTDSGWIGPYKSQNSVSVSHKWENEDTFQMRVKAKDTYNAESDWKTIPVTMPIHPSDNIFVIILENLGQQYPFFEQIISFILSYLYI